MKVDIYKLIPTIFLILATPVLADQEEDIETEVEQYCSSLMQQESQTDASLLKECIQEQFEYLNNQTDQDEPDCEFDEKDCQLT